MDLGFDPSALAAGSEELRSSLTLMAIIAFTGFFGRMVFVAFGPGLARANPFRDFTSTGFILLAAALFAGGLYVSGKAVKTEVLIKRHLIDPVAVTWLGWDSCDPEDGSYCVVVFEDGEEKIVNWYDKRVYMWEIVNLPESAVWHTLRPLPRPERFAGV